MLQRMLHCEHCAPTQTRWTAYCADVTIMAYNLEQNLKHAGWFTTERDTHNRSSLLQTPRSARKIHSISQYNISNTQERSVGAKYVLGVTGIVSCPCKAKVLLPLKYSLYENVHSLSGDTCEMILRCASRGLWPCSESQQQTVRLVYGWKLSNGQRYEIRDRL